VGLWAGLNGGRAQWAWPAAFVAAMLVGGALGMAGVLVPLAEPGILASLIVLGLLVLAAARLPLALGAALIVLFALVQGHAHGAELPDGVAPGAYMAGFALATALLHVIGIALAWVRRDGIGTPIVRGAGAAVAAVGIALAVVLSGGGPDPRGGHHRPQRESEPNPAPRVAALCWRQRA